MPTDMIHLPAAVGREVKSPCGCAVVECAPRLIDRGDFVIGRALVIVPCLGHDEVARAVAREATGDLDEVAAALEAALR